MHALDSTCILLVCTGRFPYPGPPSDNAVWMLANPNWGTINLHLGEVSVSKVIVQIIFSTITIINPRHVRERGSRFVSLFGCFYICSK